MISTIEVNAVLEYLNEIFDARPDDSSFFAGYEHAILRWMELIDRDLIGPSSLAEAQIAQICRPHDSDYTAGVWAVVSDVNSILYSAN